MRRLVWLPISVLGALVGLSLAAFVAIVVATPAPNLASTLLENSVIRAELVDEVAQSIDERINVPVGDDLFNDAVRKALATNAAEPVISEVADSAVAYQFGHSAGTVQIDVLEFLPEQTGLLGTALALLDLNITYDPSDSGGSTAATKATIGFVASMLALALVSGLAGWWRRADLLAAALLPAGLLVLAGPRLLSALIADSPSLGQQLIKAQLADVELRLVLLGTLVTTLGALASAWAYRHRFQQPLRVV